MVTGAAVWISLALAQAPAGGPTPAATEASRRVAQALAKGRYPWYDAHRDAIVPVQPPWTPGWWDWLPNWSWTPRSGGSGMGFGQGVVFVVLTLALALLIVGLAWAYRNYESAPGELGARTAAATAATIGALPPGLDIDMSDPLAAARELRARGELAGAIIALFVHQIVTLDRLRLARLAPGRTGRQLVRSVSDGWVRSRIEPTLRLFEAAFYGHRPPDSSAFETAWVLAEEWEARIAQGATAS